MVLAGYSLSEIGAIIAAEIGAAQAEAEAAVNGLLPLILPIDVLEYYKNIWKQQIQGGIVVA